jgi:hypothetical protein
MGVGDGLKNFGILLLLGRREVYKDLITQLFRDLICSSAVRQVSGAPAHP